MASQVKDFPVTGEAYLIGIDPGERWTGIAIVSANSEQKPAWQLETCVLDGTDDYLRPARLLEATLDTIDPKQYTVVCEDFKAWPVRHQSWNPMLTARLLGALQYVTERHVQQFNLQPAGSADSDLRNLALGNLIYDWKHSWPSSTRWEHALSAWRVVARYLLDEDQDLLRSFVRGKVVPLKERPIAIHSFGNRRANDLLAPPCGLVER